MGILRNLLADQKITWLNERLSKGLTSILRIMGLAGVHETFYEAS